MAGNLENAVCRGVHNRRVRADVLLAQLIKNRRTRCGLVADDGMPDALLKRRNESLREAVRKRRKRLRDRQTGNLPMTGGCILSAADLHAAPERPDGIGVRRIVRTLDLPETELRQIRQRRMTCIHHMAEGACPFIAVIRSIRQRTCADRVKDRQKNTFHTCCSLPTVHPYYTAVFVPCIACNFAEKRVSWARGDF